MDDPVPLLEEQPRSTRKSTREVRSEVISGPERRRRWSTEEKLRILAQSTAPGSSVLLVCRMHGISSGQLYTWRRQFRSGELTGFAPVAIVSEAPEGTASPPPMVGSTSAVIAASAKASAIEVELPSGVKLRITGDIEEAVLRRVFSALL